MKFSKKYFQDKRIFFSFFKTKRYQKGIDGEKWERKLKKCVPTLTTLPYVLRWRSFVTIC
jgi:hypothetical protein